jgi:DNA-binding transcriptional LysR family regulator
MDFEKIFTTIFDTVSLNKAAEVLGTANSTISSRLTALEKKLGASLLHRTARGIQLTEIGRTYYEGAKRAIAITEETEALVKTMSNGSYGTFVLNMPPGLVERKLSIPIAQFLRDNPHVQLEIKTTDNILLHMHEGFDISFHTGELPDSNLYAHKLFQDEVLVVATETYVEEFDLIKHPDNIQFLQLTREFAGESKRLVAPRKDLEWVYSNPARITVDNIECQIAFALQSIGAAILPKSFIADKLRENKIKDITHLYFERPFPLPWYAITGDNKPSHNCRAQNLIKTIKQYFEKQI